MPNAQETFGKKLEKWLENSQVKNQAELAQKVGVSPTYISNLIRDYSPTAKGGKPQPSVEMVDKLARALGVPVAEARLAAGYAPPVNSFEHKAEVKSLTDRLAAGAWASGLTDLEDEDLREAFLADMETIAESMLRRRIEEQNKRKKK